MMKRDAASVKHRMAHANGQREHPSLLPMEERSRPRVIRSHNKHTHGNRNKFAHGNGNLMLSKILWRHRKLVAITCDKWSRDVLSLPGVVTDATLIRFVGY